MANGFTTHYDNLKVARNSPTEVIRAAYRVLAQKYHPDRYPDRDEATRIMQILNEAYEVLSDPQKRHEHDQWIAEQEAINQPRVAPEPPPRANAPEIDDAARFRHEPAESVLPPRKSARKNLDLAWYLYPIALVAGIVIVAFEYFGKMWARVKGSDGLYSLLGGATLVAIGYVMVVHGKAFFPSVWTSVAGILGSPQSPSSSQARSVSVVGAAEASRDQLIPAQLIELSHVEFNLDDSRVSGRVRNGSTTELASFVVTIDVLDCTPQCIRVGTKSQSIAVLVPPGESRDFSSRELWGILDSNEKPVIRGQGRFRVSVGDGCNRPVGCL